MFRKLTKGFTMIELLVVIAVIGILSVALLATLNPLEQIRKGRDTSSRTDASQALSALERYNASLGYFPWEGRAGNSTTIAWVDASSTDPITVEPVGAATDLCPGACTPADILNPLTDTSEVKAGFVDRILNKTNKIYLHYVGGASSSVYACFDPESFAFSKEAFDRCATLVTGVWPTDMPDRLNMCPDSDANYTAGAFNAASSLELICLP